MEIVKPTLEAVAADLATPKATPKAAAGPEKVPAATEVASTEWSAEQQTALEGALQRHPGITGCLEEPGASALAFRGGNYYSTKPEKFVLDSLC